METERMKNKLEKKHMENQMRVAADWEPLARGILREPRLFQFGFVGICEGAGPPERKLISAKRNWCR